MGPSSYLSNGDFGYQTTSLRVESDEVEFRRETTTFIIKNARIF